MGVEQFRRPVKAVGGFSEPTETITLSTAAQTLSNEGISFVTYSSSGVASDMLLPTPALAGIHKYIVVDNQTTSLEANINLASTGSVFYGTTFNTATIATTAVDAPTLHLISVSTSQWAVMGLTTAAIWTLAASTGSTGQ